MHELIHQLLQNTKLDNDLLKKIKRTYAKQHNLAQVPSHIQLLAAYRELLKSWSVQKSSHLERVLKKRSIRSASGIVSVQVLTKPFRCPGKCIFCPNDFTMPKSYINTEPGAMRALLNNFDPIKQVHNRLLSLTLTWHATDKIEMIVLWGTRDVYPQDYKEQFVKWLYDACNSFSDFFASLEVDQSNTRSSQYTTQDFDYSHPETIQESLQRNETADHRIIGLTIETRPEYVNDENCQFWRRLGVTRIEMGIQSLFDHVLHANKRGHTVEQSRQAVHLLRQYGFKMSLHVMPGLYQSTVAEDIETFRLLYTDPRFKPDEIKFYPTSVIPNTELYDLYLSGEYKPLEIWVIQDIIRTTFREIIPPYTRIKRLIRDIPSTEIVAGSSVTNLAQLTHDQISKDLQTDLDGRRALYARLFPRLHEYDSLWDISWLLGQYLVSDESMISCVPRGFRPHTDLTRQFVSLDTRSREMRNKTKSDPDTTSWLVVRAYRSSVGIECFMSVEDELGYLYGFTRLLLPDLGHTRDREWLWAQTALIRELHVYGNLQSLSSLAWAADPNPREQSKQQVDQKAEQVQHTWIGSLLMSAAEQISRDWWYTRLSVISGIWVRKYYERLGYQLEGTYMLKTVGGTKQ